METCRDSREAQHHDNPDEATSIPCYDVGGERRIGTSVRGGWTAQHDLHELDRPSHDCVPLDAGRRSRGPTEPGVASLAYSTDCRRSFRIPAVTSESAQRAG